MKKVVLFCVLLMGVLNYSIAQRYAYVDTQYILDNMPEYAAAQLELDKVSNAIQEVSVERNYAFVFDISNQSNLLFADPKYNMSDQVLRKMGIKID
jgi:outer membrane protein